MRRAIEEIQDAGVEVDIWKIEGVDEREDAERLAEQTRAGARAARASCACCSGRGASTEKVEHWLTERLGGRRLRRLCHRPLDLVGLAQGLARRRARARGGRRTDRRELPALHRRLRAAGRAPADGAQDAPEPRHASRRSSASRWPRSAVAPSASSVRRAVRTRKRTIERTKKRSSMRFWIARRLAARHRDRRDGGDVRDALLAARLASRARSGLCSPGSPS